jgi:hypothetical protein
LLPTQNEFAKLTNGVFINAPIPGWRFGSDNNFLFLPAAGKCDFNNGQVDTYGGRYGYYWSSSSADYYSAHSLYFDDIEVYPTSRFRAFGLSVRCVVD